MSEETNKRVVKKTNTKKMSIKVSTEDKEVPSTNNLDKNKNDQSKNEKSITNAENSETSLNQLKEKSQNMEIELGNINNELKSEEEKTRNDLGSMNEQLEALNKELTNVSKKNKSLMNKLKKMEKEVTSKFTEKFKASKVVENQKSKAYNKDINIEIKSLENETNNVQKDIKYNQKEIDRLNKIMEDNKEGGEGEGKLQEQYNELKKNITEIQKEINKLNTIKFNHKNCTKNATILKSRLNVLFNDIEFESKRKSMISSLPQKKEKTKIKEYNERIDYGNKIKNNLIKSTKFKYNPKTIQYVNQKSIDFLKSDITENEKQKEKEKNNSLDKINKKNKKTLDAEKIAYNKSKEAPKIYLFTEAEKELFKKIVPDNLFNNLNDKYTQKETEMKEIEENCKDQKEMKKQLYMDNLKYEEINLKQQELRMRKANLMANHIKNSKKLIEIKNKIKMLQKDINKEDKKIVRVVERNNSINQIIKNYIEQKKKEKEEKKENEEQKEIEQNDDE